MVVMVGTVILTAAFMSTFPSRKVGSVAYICMWYRQISSNDFIDDIFTIIDFGWSHIV
jgi:hypothetical protein